MNLGGEPDRDDSGLPPVDIVVPDDARELDRDVQAYYREQRARRRHLRRRRWSAPLARDGMIVPLLAGCLILALIAGTLLTVFTAWPGNLTSQQPQTPAGRSGTARSPQKNNTAAPRRSANSSSSPGISAAGSTAVTAGASLPNAVLTVAGRGRVGAQVLKTSVLALVPAGCACVAAVRTLASQAARAHVPVVLVGSTTAMPTVRRLAGEAGQVQVARDPQDRLGSTYQRAGLTAVLVNAAGSVQLARHLGSSLQLTSELKTLSSPAASTSPSPAG